MPEPPTMEERYYKLPKEVERPDKLPTCLPGYVLAYSAERGYYCKREAEIPPIEAPAMVEPPVEEVLYQPPGIAPAVVLPPLVAPPEIDLSVTLEFLYPEMFEPDVSFGISAEDLPDVILENLKTWAVEDPESFIVDLYERTTPEQAKAFMETWGFIPEAPPIEETIATLFPDKTIEEFGDFMEEDWEGFVRVMQTSELITEKETLLKAMGYSDEEIDDFLLITTSVTGWQAVWNKLRTSTARFWFQTKDYLFTILPQAMFPDVKVGQSKVVGMTDEQAKKKGLAYTIEEATQTNLRQREMRDKFRELSVGNREQYEEWVKGHPELKPPPEWEGEILTLLKDNPMLILDPAFIGYVAADSAAFMAAFWGATAVVGLATKNPIAGMAAGVAVTTPAQSQDLYQDLLWAGATEEQATELAVPFGLLISSVEMLGGLAVLKAVGAMPGLRPFYQLFRRNLQREVAKGILSTMAKRGLISITEIELAEIFEEIVQGAIQNALVKTFDESREVLEGITETVLRTAISVFPLALIGGGTNTVVTYRQMTEEQRGRVETAQAKLEDAGLPPEQAEMVAVTKFAETEEGRVVVDKAVEEVTKPPVPEEVPAVPEVPLTEALIKEGDEIVTRAEVIEPTNASVIEFRRLVEQAKVATTPEAQRQALVGMEALEDEVRAIAKVPAVPEVKPPVVEVKVPPPLEVPERTVYSEGGVPVSPEETIAQDVVENIPILQDIGVLERVRPTRKVFERLGLYETYKGIQKAEVELGEAKAAFTKKLKEMSKLVDKERRHLVFRELENPGSQVGLTFNEKRAVSFFRENFNRWADTLNLPQEKRVKNYVTHIFEADIAEQLKEKHPLDPAIARALEYRVPKTIFNPFLQKRLGATVGLMEDPFVAASAYESRQLNVLYYEPFIKKIAAIANDPNQPRSVRDYLKDYSRRMTGIPSKLDLEINTTLQELAGKLRGLPGGEAIANFLTRGNPSGWVAYNYTSAIYTLWLGFKPTSAIRNLSQHTLIIAEVGPVNFADGLRMRFTKEGKAALAESLVLRSRKAAFVPGIDDSFATQWVDKFRETALWMFRAADKQNVSDAFLGGYVEAKRLLPDADRQVWLDRGDEVAADTQYLYTKMNSMAISQSSVGRVFSILTTWSENWMELMTKWVSKRPSQVFLQYERATGVKATKATWSTSYKAILMYMIIIGIGFAIKEKTRLKAWEYTGLTSIRYLADIAGGDFPGLQYIGAAANLIAGFVADDDRRFNEGLSQLNPIKMAGILRQLDSVAKGDKDWLTLLLYLKGRDWKLKQLTDKWEKKWKDYEALETTKERDKYREDNPLIEAQMFIASKFTTLTTDEARDEVLRLIEKNNIEVEFIDGYDKVFGVDTDEKFIDLKKLLGTVELDEEGKQKLLKSGELDYYTTSNFASDVNALVKVVGRYKVEKDGNPLAVEYLRAKDLFVQYESLTEDDARVLFRQQFPDVEAQLYLWGRIASFKNPKSAEILLRLMEKYNISPEAVPAFLDTPERYDELFTPVFKMKQRWFDLDTEYENYGNPESPLYIEDDDARGDAREKLKADNPKWVDDLRRIEAIENDGADFAEGWVDRGHRVDKFSAGSAEVKYWLLDNPEVHKWALEQELLTDDLLDENKDILKLKVDYGEQFDRWDSYGDRESPNYLADEALRAEERQKLLDDKGFRIARLRIQAFSEGYSIINWDEYVAFHELPAWGSWRDRFLLDPHNRQFATEYYSELIGEYHKRPDLTEVKPLKRDLLYQKFYDDFRRYDLYDEAGKEKMREDKRFYEAWRRVQAYDYGLSGELNDAYLGFYRVKDGRIKRKDIIHGHWFEDDWFLIDNMDFYNTMFAKDIWKDEDRYDLQLAKQARKVWELYRDYWDARQGESRLNLRARYPKLDRFLLALGEVSKLVSDRGDAEGEVRFEDAGLGELAESLAEMQEQLEALE